MSGVLEKRENLPPYLNWMKYSHICLFVDIMGIWQDTRFARFF